jgi:hypothetical protein
VAPTDVEALRRRGEVDAPEEQSRLRVVGERSGPAPEGGLEVLGRHGVAAVGIEPLDALAHLLQRRA